jgi:mRNA-degrading endonuclease RelE of RelBE toxin-antitoxin system
MVEISSEAKEDLKKFDSGPRKLLLDEIEEQLGSSKNQENIQYVHKPEFGIEFHRLKLKNSELDHRVYFDYINSEVVVFAVRHRDHSYTRKDLSEVVDRLGNLEK